MRTKTLPKNATSLRSSLWLILCFLSVSLIPVTSLAQERVFSIKDAAVLPGSQIQMELCLSELQGFAGGDFTIGFDASVVSILYVKKSSLTTDFMLYYGTPASGRISISMAAAEGVVTAGPGSIAVLELQLASQVAMETLSVLSVRTARWYDESSVRHTLLGDNGLLAAGVTPPANEPLTLALGNDAGNPGGVVNLPLTLSMGHSAGKVSGDITFNPVLLSFMDFQLNSALTGWSSQVQTDMGTLHFNLSSTAECTVSQAVKIGTVSFSIAGSVEPATTDVGLSGTTISNLEGLSYSHFTSRGTVQVNVAAEPTPTPTLIPTATPTPTPTIDELHPADFNGDGTVDQTDLLLFLEAWHQEVTRP